MFVGLIATIHVSLQSDDALIQGDKLTKKHAEEYLEKLASSVKKVQPPSCSCLLPDH